MDFDAEDKTCRICGFVDTSNINIFDSKWNNLLYKILTVFPLIVYESDPLPKNICRKCVTNVSLMFDETTKLFRVQKKWIDNVRVNQPNHPYFKILDLIEKSNNRLIMEARTIEPNFPHRGPRFYPNWLFSSTAKDPTGANPSTSSSGPSFKGKITSDEMPPAKREFLKKIPETSSPTLNIFKSKDITIGPRKLPGPPDAQSGTGKPRPNSDQFKELKNKLQSNGCTLMSLVSGNKSAVTRQPLMTPTNIGERCKYCAAVFFNIHYLAKHQLEHLAITDKRIFDKRYLDKKTRRGRLIPKGDKKCIRCLNCWKLFVDNRSILDHWSTGECDFYCQICGKEFPNNPKMLREHVPAAHGISYRSSKRRTPDSVESPSSIDGGSQKDFSGYSSNSELAEEVKKVKPEPLKNAVDYLSDSPPAYKPKAKKQKMSKNSKVKCSICNLEFSNFRSKNSHMRKHKKKEVPVQEPELEPEPEPEHEAETPISIKQENEDSPIAEANGVSGKKEPNDTEKSSEVSNTQADSGDKPRLVVKKLSDLQDPSVTSQHSDESQKKKPSTPVVSQPEEKSNEKVIVNNAEDHMEYGKIYNCHPCGKQFSSKTELFEHKRQCQSNNKFACGFCLRAFITSADLQMHIMLMHRDS